MANHGFKNQGKNIEEEPAPRADIVRKVRELFDLGALPEVLRAIYKVASENINPSADDASNQPPLKRARTRAFSMLRDSARIAWENSL